MKTPPSLHFTPILLTHVFNRDRQHLAAPLRLPDNDNKAAFGAQTFHGIPFELGLPHQPNVILLEDEAVNIEVADIQATYLIFLHVVENRVRGYLEDLSDFAGNIPGAGDGQGNELGGLVSEYSLAYADGTTLTKPILRRFAIQQGDISWGASPFAAVPAFETAVFPTTTEEHFLGRIPQRPYGRGETRTRSARDLAEHHLWLYALPNPHPEKLIQHIICSPKQVRSLIYAISYTQVKTHPLRPGLRQKLKLKVPPGVQLNALGELEEVSIDLGQVISARAALVYDDERWLSSADRDVQPQLADQAVITNLSPILWPNSISRIPLVGQRLKNISPSMIWRKWTRRQLYHFPRPTVPCACAWSSRKPASRWRFGCICMARGASIYRPKVINAKLILTGLRITTANLSTVSTNTATSPATVWPIYH
jgi:hypothetical protein